MANPLNVVQQFQQAIGKGDFTAARHLLQDNLSFHGPIDTFHKARAVSGGISWGRCMFLTRLGVAEGKATEHENYMEIYDPKTFIAAVTALFEQRTIEFTD